MTKLKNPPTPNKTPQRQLSSPKMVKITRHQAFLIQRIKKKKLKANRSRQLLHQPAALHKKLLMAKQNHLVEKKKPNQENL